MNNYISDNIKRYFTTGFIIFFSFLLIVLAISSEFFQSDKNNNLNNSLNQAPVRSDILANIKSIRFQNRFGTFNFTLEEDHWFLTDPKILPIKKQVITNMLQLLAAIKVQKIESYDPINLANFSLDRPLMSLRLFTKLDDQVSIHFGLTNPVNNTTYISIENTKTIYQIEAIEHNLDSIELRQMIEPRVFAFNPQTIIQYEIYLKDNTSPILVFTKKDDDWSNSKNKDTTDRELVNYFEKLTDMKAGHILDQLSVEANASMEKMLQSCQYKIAFTTQNKLTKKYHICHITSDIPSFDIDRKSNVIVWPEESKIPFILSKEILALIEKSRAM